MNLWEKLPAADNPSYFNFAEQRTLLGIPHFGDVISNLPFLFVGVWALLFLAKKKKKDLHVTSGLIIAVSSILICLGSAYFHWKPNTETLFWDRLPMSVAFGSIMALIIGDRTKEKFGWWVTAILIPLGVLTVVGWSQGWFSLRPYLILQFGSMIAVFTIACLRRKGKIPNKAIWACLGFYVAAKVFEVLDLPVYELTGFISGHTIKHVLAAVALYKILGYMK